MIPTTPGHSGVVRFCIGSRGGAFFLCGRSHLYEGTPFFNIANAARIASITDAEGLLLCSACGGVGPYAGIGDIHLFNDVIRFPPYRWSHSERPAAETFHDRMPSPRKPLNPHFSNAVTDAARRAEVALNNGVIALVTGPCYETAAEIEALRRLDVSAVSMSCDPVLKQAARLGVATAMLGGIANIAGQPGKRLDHQLILDNVSVNIAPKFVRIFRELIGL